jgi:hypothetical protein
VRQRRRDQSLSDKWRTQLVLANANKASIERKDQYRRTPAAAQGSVLELSNKNTTVLKKIKGLGVHPLSLYYLHVYFGYSTTPVRIYCLAYLTKSIS